MKNETFLTNATMMKISKSDEEIHIYYIKLLVNNFKPKSYERI